MTKWSGLGNSTELSRVGLSQARAAIMYILSHILGSERPSYFSIEGLKSLGYLIVRRCREKAGKLLTAPGLADGA
jgi:hypothetical protein